MRPFTGTRNKSSDYEPIISEELWEDSFIENFRYMVEQCDALKHLNITVDSYNAFSGVATSYVEDLLDNMISASTAMVSCTVQ